MFFFPSHLKRSATDRKLMQNREDTVYQVISVQPVGMNTGARVTVPAAVFPRVLYVV